MQLAVVGSAKKMACHNLPNHNLPKALFTPQNLKVVL
jgi:hypothetical protein